MKSFDWMERDRYEGGLAMQSGQLGGNGFTEWHRFGRNRQEDILPELPLRTGVYIIRRKTAFGRFIGKSDIVYIGCSVEKKRGLRGRVHQYYQPGNRTTAKRISLFVSRMKDLELSYTVTSASAARQVERSLLNKYHKDHGELPPWNRQG